MHILTPWTGWPKVDHKYKSNKCKSILFYLLIPLLLCLSWVFMFEGTYRNLFGGKPALSESAKLGGYNGDVYSTKSFEVSWGTWGLDLCREHWEIHRLCGVVLNADGLIMMPNCMIFATQGLHLRPCFEAFFSFFIPKSPLGRAIERYARAFCASYRRGH